MSVQSQLSESFAQAFLAVLGTAADPVVRRSARADFQVNGALGVAKSLGITPRDLALRIVNEVDLDGIASSLEIAGAGFINVVLEPCFVSQELNKMLADPDRLCVAPAAVPERVLVDYSAPNVAKEMHIGHLRSIVIGDVLARLSEWQGHEVLRANHIGDWGTPFGMLIEHLLDTGEATAVSQLSQGDLDQFYKAARSKYDEQEQFAKRSRERVVLLQSGDEDTLRLWNVLVEESKHYFLNIYADLGVLLGEDDFFGESYYNEMLHPLLDSLEDLGILQASSGAQVVFPPGFHNRDGDSLPMIVQKSDGGFGYPATDLAALKYRLDVLECDRILYVIGLPQKQHLEMVFATARLAGWLDEHTAVEHVGFGTILGQDGKPFRSRSGDSEKLSGVLQESVERSFQIVSEKSPQLPERERRDIAHSVGVAALKYFDLSIDRQKDYIFDWDSVLSYDGNSAPYLQYARARIQSILSKLGHIDLDEVDWTGEDDRQLGLKICQFAIVMEHTGASYNPHILANYLFELAAEFTRFYHHCPILTEDDVLTRSRGSLVKLTGDVMDISFSLLGIDVLDRM